MKTNFALYFTDTSIALLHRTAKGWSNVGETPFDAPDLTEALAYMRSIALGLEPGGFASKLILPASQVLYAELTVQGETEAERRAEVARALESRTPYKAEEIAFDISGAGQDVQVAAVARDTLDEAESFAATHQFNPVSFVAIPESGRFDGEPWFGETGMLAQILPPGEAIERDRDVTKLLVEKAKPRRSGRSDGAFPEVDLAGDDALATDMLAADMESAAALAKADPAPKIAGAAQLEPSLDSTTTAGAPADQALTSRRAEQTAPQDAPAPSPVDLTAAAELAAQPTIFAPVAAPEPTPAQVPAPKAEAEAASESASPAVSPAEPASPEAAPSHAAAAGSLPTAAAKPVTTAATAPEATTPAKPYTPAPAQPVHPKPSANAPQPGAQKAPPEPEIVAEAPFAEVPEALSYPEDRLPAGATPVVPPLDDVPPAPSAAILAAYNRGRGTETHAPVHATPAAAAAKGTSPRIERPNAATLATHGVLRPDQAVSATPRPVQPPQPTPGQGTARPAAKPGKKGLGALVTAPSIPGTRKAASAKPAPTPAPAPGNMGSAATNAAAEDAARSLGRAAFAKTAPRAKPRHLGLILTVILLLCLALVAAWSSFFLASGPDQSGSETAIAANQDAATPGGSAADGAMADLDPEAMADGELDGTATPLPGDLAAGDTAPGASAALDTPALAATPEQQGDIVLSLADAPPPAFDALNLPNPGSLAEAPPEAPMPPPPFGTVYRYDANGLLEPSPAGIPSPDGYMIFAGKPQIVPPERSAVATAAAEAARTAAATPAASDVSPPDVAQAGVSEAGATETGAAATAQSGGIAPPAATAGTAALLETSPAAQPNPELIDRRPKLRPQDNPAANTAGDDAALQDPTAAAAATADASSPRPLARPKAIETAGEAARSQTAAASLASQEADLASASATLSLSEASNPSLLAISRRPFAKPKDFSHAVDAAIAAAIRSPDPEPEAEAPPVRVAAAAAAPQPASASRSAEEEDEPEPVAAAPRIPTRANVAQQATFKKAINLSKINLIGIYGSASNRHALVRLSNGKIRKVSPGEKIDGGTVQAITQSQVRYQKGSRLLALEMPNG